MNQRPGKHHSVDTRAVHGGDETATGPVSTPIVHSSTFSFKDVAALERERDLHAGGAYYQRYGHPTLHACEKRLAALEESETALLFSSGMAAISSVFLARLRAGDHVVALRQSYGGTFGLLEWGASRFGWHFDLVDARHPEAWETAFRKETRLFVLESPTNPTLCVADLAHAAQIAHRHHAWLAVDNTVASPIGQHPLSFGADIVMYSATKSIGGHGDLMAGVVAGSAEKLEAVWEARKVFGPIPDPGLAWQIERSLKTLPLRVRAANENALELAVRLEAHPAVGHVFYPGLIKHPGHEIARRQMRLGFGPLMAIDVKGGAPAAAEFMNALKLFRLAPSLGGVESLASIPAMTSHIQLDERGRAEAGIPEGCVRLSVGIEDDSDLWADLEQALHKASAVRV